MEKITILENKRIVLGVTGSIAVYKVIDLASKLTQAGALVDVIITEAAQEFVSPLAFQSVTGRPVYTHLWRGDSTGGLPTHIAHVGLGEGADLIAVIPATANTLAKLAHGMADDLLSVTAVAAQCPLLIAPAMDGGMYGHPATQANVRTLVERGAILVEPETGRFASGLVGQGRLPETPTLIGAIRQALAKKGGLGGKKIVVTAGGTREPLDPVRYITNRSSGKQGYAIAQAAADVGAEVVLITTVESLAIPYGVEAVPVHSAQEMHNAVLAYTHNAHALIMAAAVADFRPTSVATQKIKKTDDTSRLTVELSRNPDILLAVKSQRAETGFPRITVGFAAESENLQQNAEGKLKRKGLDLLVANDITAPDAGFSVDTNRVILFDRKGNREELSLMSKARVAEMIIQRVINLAKENGHDS
jgi:phosphopantothenoylcysteine decarboxylase / phosphopantothenate---cysteine ligase